MPHLAKGSPRSLFLRGRSKPSAPDPAAVPTSPLEEPREPIRFLWPTGGRRGRRWLAALALGLTGVCLLLLFLRGGGFRRGGAEDALHGGGGLPSIPVGGVPVTETLPPDPPETTPAPADTTAESPLPEAPATQAPVPEASHSESVPPATEAPASTDSPASTESPPETEAPDEARPEATSETDSVFDPEVESTSESVSEPPPEAPFEDTSAVIPETESADPPETIPLPVPDGCFPITPVDRSETERGAGYVRVRGGSLPAALPTGRLWDTDTRPTVLIVHTQPLAGYGDGAPWFDPSAGGLSLVDSPYDPRGVVALGDTLTAALEAYGVTVLHLRVTVAEGETAAAVYDRTAALVADCCRLYPAIGLVLDLGRTAELTEEGHVLRTAGDLGGETCAQLRVEVAGGRDTSAVARDLAAALTLRRLLWETEPSLSRPVELTHGVGLSSGGAEGAVLLTLSVGSAGNTPAEAERLILPLAAALSELLTK